MSKDNISDAKDKLLFEQLQKTILSYNGEEAKQITQTIIEQKIDPIHVMNEAIADIASLLGEKFENGEIFIPHLVMGGDILSDVSSMLSSSMTEGQTKKMGRKVVVIGTVESDIHSIGKNIVAMLLKMNGFKVHDLGVDVKSEVFIQQAETHNANIIALSSLLTTTMPYQQEVIEDLIRLNLRDKYKIMIGGGPITQVWADEIKADGFGKDAIEAINVAKQLAEIK